ncbi:MAG: PEGA domain-containing protein [Deltaproteobacteria bacterium]|nr:PEGA domain-containing protein [Deltaproteobacteria bacterium]
MSNPSSPSVRLARRGAAVLCSSVALAVSAPTFAAPPPARTKSSNSSAQAPKSAAATSASKGSPKTTAVDPSAQADVLAAEAMRAVERGDLDTGRKLFLESLALKSSFDTMGNLGAVELAQKRHRDCAEHLTLSLRNYPPTGSEASKKRTQEKLAECRKKVGAVRVALLPDGASVTLDGAAAGTAPLADLLFIEPGAHTLTFTKEGHRSETVSLSAVGGGEQTLTLSLSPLPTLAPRTDASSHEDPTPSTAHLPRDQAAPDEASAAPLWPVFVGAGATVALLGGGVGLWLASSSSEKDGDTLKEQLAAAGKVCPADCGDLIDTYDRASSQRNAATGLLVSSGVVAAGTAAYSFVFRPTIASSYTAWLPIVGPDRVGVMMSGSF